MEGPPGPGGGGPGPLSGCPEDLLARPLPDPCPAAAWPQRQAWRTSSTCPWRGGPRWPPHAHGSQPSLGRAQEPCSRTCRHMWVPRARRVPISPLSWEFLLKTKQTKKVLVLPRFLPAAKWVSPGLLGLWNPTPALPQAPVPPCWASAWGPGPQLRYWSLAGQVQQNPQLRGRRCGELPVGRGTMLPHFLSGGSPLHSEL